MFIILAIFCYLFILRAKTKEYGQAKWRICIYSLCCVARVVSVALIAINFMTDNGVAKYVNRPVYVFEAVGLIAFGIAWLTASRTLPFITHQDERVSISPFND